MKLSDFKPEVLGIYEVTFADHPYDTDLIESFPWDNNFHYKCVEAYCNVWGIEYDSITDDALIERLNDLSLWTVNLTANKFRNADGSQAYFVNKYEIYRCYGGPEEGGWWFDAGCYEESYIVSSYEAAVELRNQLHIADDDEWERNGFRSSNREIGYRIELHPGKDYPERAPHYE